MGDMKRLYNAIPVKNYKSLGLVDYMYMILGQEKFLVAMKLLTICLK